MNLIGLLLEVEQASFRQFFSAVNLCQLCGNDDDADDDDELIQNGYGVKAPINMSFKSVPSSVTVYQFRSIFR